MKYWHKLLLDWRKKNKNGFSIPFLIGSQNFIDSEGKHQDIRDLMTDIFNNGLVDIYISYCPDIDDLILGIRDESKLRIAGKYVKLNDKENSNLFLTKIAYDLGNDFEEVVLTLLERYQRYIDKSEYSINNRKRGDFSDKEKGFIIDSLNELKKAPN